MEKSQTDLELAIESKEKLDSDTDKVPGLFSAMLDRAVVRLDAKGGGMR